MYWVLLFAAIVLEITATTLMKLTDGLTKLVPTVLMILFYILSFSALSLSLKKIDVSVAYAIWSAVGTGAIAVIGYFLFHEQMNTLKIVALAIIIFGVVLLNLSSKIA